MSFFISDALAQSAAPAQGADPIASLILPIGLVVLFYFFLIRPQSKRQKEQKLMISELQKGEEVLTSGGILGKISKLDDNFIQLEVSKEQTLTVQRAAIQSVMPKGTIKEFNNN